MGCQMQLSRLEMCILAQGMCRRAVLRRRCQRCENKLLISRQNWKRSLNSSHNIREVDLGVVEVEASEEAEVEALELAEEEAEEEVLQANWQEHANCGILLMGAITKTVTLCTHVMC